MMLLRSICIAALVATLPVAAHATTAIDYNVLVRGNFTSSGSDTEGKIAAGGNINVGGYSIGLANQGSSTDYAAVAGGSFTGGYGTAYGSILASSFSGNFTTANGGSQVTYASGATSPIAIASEMSRLTSLSQDLYTNASNYGTLGTVSDYYGQMTLNGSSSGINIFNVSASAVASGSINITVPTGGLVVINVSGTSDSITNAGSGGLSNYYSDANATNILWNFYQATSLTMQGVDGSILAPLAAIAANGGAIHGQVFADSYTGQTQIDYAPFATQSGQTNLLSRSVGPVPEPASWAMMVIGFGAIGFAMRAQRGPKRQAA